MSDTTTIVSSAAALLGVLLGGGFAYWQSSKNQSRQFEHEREVRERQYEHERVVHEREVLRDALDEALVSARTRYSTMTELQNQRAFGAQALEKLAVTQHLVPIAQAKLRIRLGVDHLITKAYDDVKDELNKLKKVIRKESQNEPEDRAADCKEHEEFARKAMERFAAGAAALMNVPDSGFSSSDAQERVSQAISAYLDDGEDSASD